MTERSKEFWLVAFFLSKFGKSVEGKRTQPPVEFETSQWKETYRMFYESLGDGRSIESFENSLKNARDSFDSHIENSSRIGWRDKERNPTVFNKASNNIFTKYFSKSRSDIWNQVKELANVKVKEYEKVIEDLISIQQSENNTEVVSKTEGGRKVIISYTYERSPSLRNQAFKIHGYNCGVCGFNFEKAYGKWGKGFGEAHHIEPLFSSGNNKRLTNPKLDLIILCANCHRMTHRKKGITLTIEELKKKINKKYIDFIN